MRSFSPRELALRAALCTGLAVAAASTSSAPVRAHSFEPALLLLQERSPGVYRLTWRLPPLDPEAGEVLAPRLPPHCRPLAQTDSSAGEQAVPAMVDCRPGNLAGGEIAVDGLDALPLDVIVRISWSDGSVTNTILHSEQSRLSIPGAAASAQASDVLLRYAELGVQHILFGIDHLLFVLGLMLLVGNFRSLVKTVTAFTLAHSLTLALAVLGIVDVPSAPVEAAISLSIVLLAVEIARVETGYTTAATLAHRHPWVVAFAFGLLHGLGFAGALGEIGLPRDQIALSLLAFNLGVEAGQLAFVIALAVVASAGARMLRSRQRLRLIPAYAMGVLAVAWTLERVQQFWAAAG